MKLHLVLLKHRRNVRCVSGWTVEVRPCRFALKLGMNLDQVVPEGSDVRLNYQGIMPF